MEYPHQNALQPHTILSRYRCAELSVYDELGRVRLTHRIHSSWFASFVLSEGYPLVMDGNVPDSHRFVVNKCHLHQFLMIMLRSLWLTSRAAVGYVAATSLLVLLGYFTNLFTSCLVARRVGYAPLNDCIVSAASEREGQLERRVHDHGGRIIFAFQVFRVLSTVSLFILATFVTSGPFPEPRWALV